VFGAGGKASGERKGLTMKERLQKCQQTERQRITFGKVSPSSQPLLAAATLCVVRTNHCYMHDRNTVFHRCLLLLGLTSVYTLPAMLQVHILHATLFPATSSIMQQLLSYA
jgi:hypothetical protein